MRLHYKRDTMSFKLTNNDYIQLLNYYQINVPKKRNTLKKMGEKILAQKLCSCIKKVGPLMNKEPLAIGACTRSIFTRKKLKRKKFQCKKNRYVKFTKTSKRTLKLDKKHV